MPMKNDAMTLEHGALRSEVQRKMGRNLLSMQQVEQMLKYLAEYGSLEGNPETIEATQAKWAEKVRQKMTMGLLAEHYADKILVDAGELPPERANVDKWWISFKFTSTVSAQSRTQITTDLQILVNERNDLVHHFLVRWKPESFEALQAAEPVSGRPTRESAADFPSPEERSSTAGCRKGGTRRNSRLG